MTVSYRKRDIGHWNQGKSCKGVRKAKERAYAENEIDLQIAEQDESFRYRHYSRKPNKEAQLQHQVEWYERIIAESERKPQASWRCAMASYARDGLRKTKKKLRELREESELKAQPSVTQIAEAWTKFESPVPLSYVVASRRAIRKKNGQ